MDVVQEILETNFLLKLENKCYSDYNYEIERGREMKDLDFLGTQVEITTSNKMWAKLSEVQSRITNLLKKLDKSQRLVFVTGLENEIIEPKFLFTTNIEFCRIFQPILKEYRIFVLTLRNIYSPAESKEEIENVEIDTSVLELRTKLILLDHLGIINVLRMKEQFMNNTELSKFLADILETDSNRKTKAFESIRTDLRYMGHPNDPKCPKTSVAIKKANSILTKYGFSVLE